METFKEIEYVNPDGSIVPKMGIGGWNSYHWNCSECATILFAADDLREHFATAHNVTSVRYLCVDCPKVIQKPNAKRQQQKPYEIFRCIRSTSALYATSGTTGRV